MSRVSHDPIASTLQSRQAAATFAARAWLELRRLGGGGVAVQLSATLLPTGASSCLKVGPE